MNLRRACARQTPKRRGALMRGQEVSPAVRKSARVADEVWPRLEPCPPYPSCALVVSRGGDVARVWLVTNPVATCAANNFSAR